MILHKNLKKSMVLLVISIVLIIVGIMLLFLASHKKEQQPLMQSSTTSSEVKLYPVHKNITATVFWVGEPIGNGSSEDNALSAWDDEWQAHYGGYDDYVHRKGYYPQSFTPNENPFYLDLPYNDYTDEGIRKATAPEGGMKNRWVKIMKDGNVCYGQIEDAGPYEYDDVAYVFGDGSVLPKSKEANNAGMDVSPALRDCLKFTGLNNADNKVDWQFVEAKDVPDGPWKKIVTTSGINWK